MSEDKLITRQQRYAKAAMNALKRLENEKKCSEKKFVSFAKRFPALVHTCGLVQAVSFAEAKKVENENYLTVLANVLGEVIPDLKDKNVLLEKARTAPLPKYMLLTHEVIEAATWLKRYTEALSDLK